MKPEALFLVALFGLFTEPAALAEAPVEVPSSMTAEQALLLAAWESYTEALKHAGRTIIAQDTGHPVDTAEGFRYLALLSGLAAERIQYYQNPRYPTLSRTLDLYRKIGLDSSDNTYRTASFEPGGSYVIRGVRGNSTYLGIQFNRDQASVANLNDEQISFNDDGSFEIYLTPERRGENWFALPADANNLYVREIFIDWVNERPATMWMERLDVTLPAPVLSPAVVSAQFDTMAGFVETNLRRWHRYVAGSRQGRLNQLPAPRATPGEGGSIDNLYSGGYFSIEADEALLIEFEAVPARLWNAQLGNAWFQSLDYQYRQTSLNNHQATVDTDGKVRMVIAAMDPGVANWLDTAGRQEGIMFLRWNMPERAPATPVVKRVSLANLDQHLPPTTKRVDKARRQEQLDARYRAVARRFAE